MRARSGMNGRELPALCKLTRASNGAWPTPRTAGMCGGTGNFEQMKRIAAAGVITDAERRQMTAGNGCHLNPIWVEWLMGFPLGWTAVAA